MESVKEYYDFSKINIISGCISSGDFNTANRLVDEYLNEYPNDCLAYILKGRILINLGDLRHGYKLAKEHYSWENFHGRKSLLFATCVYCDTLKEAHFEEEASRCYEAIIARFDRERPRDDYKRFLNNYLGFLLTTKKYKELITFVDNHEFLDGDEVLVKKAQAYTTLGHPVKALELLDKVQGQDSPTLHKSLTYGNAYFKLAGQERFSNEILRKAEAYYLKALKQKSHYYYYACYNLAIIYKRLGIIDKALQYLENARSCYVNFNNYVKDDIYALECSIYLQAFNLEKCEEAANQIVNKYTRTRQLLRIYFARGEYQRCIDIVDDMLAHGYQDESNVEEFVNYHFFKISALIRLGEYDKAKAYYESEKAFKTSNTTIKRLIDLGLDENAENITGYIPEQVKNYDRNASIDLIANKTIYGDSAFFKDREEVARAVEYAEQNIPNQACLHIGVLDQYHLNTSEFGRVDDCKSDTLVVSTLADTYKVINAFPLIKNRSEQDYKVSSKPVKRLSQIDKFNKRYGTNK